MADGKDQNESSQASFHLLVLERLLKKTLGNCLQFLEFTAVCAQWSQNTCYRSTFILSMAFWSRLDLAEISQPQTEQAQICLV